MLVHQILKGKPEDGVMTLPPGTTVSAAAEFLSTHRIGAIVISKDGKIPLGILSERDIVLEMMTVGRFRHLPVLDGAEMVGLISIGDVVKARLSELSMEKDALEGMIMGH